MLQLADIVGVARKCVAQRACRVVDAMQKAVVGYHLPKHKRILGQTKMWASQVVLNLNSRVRAAIGRAIFPTQQSIVNSADFRQEILGAIV